MRSVLDKRTNTDFFALRGFHNMKTPKLDREQDLFRQEARRLAQLPAGERKEALAVHRRIADDPRLSEATRDHARHVADTLETLIQTILRKP
jgi:hypothetical protein